MAPTDQLGEWITKAIADGRATITQQGKRPKITYVAVGVTEFFDDPEELVRADFWAELIYRYGYPEFRVGVEVPIPDRVPNDRADLIVYRDDQRTDPYAVIECKAPGITDAEFNQAAEQAVGNGSWAKFRADYVMVVAGTSRRCLDVKNFSIGERDKNIIADLPAEYAAPEDFKYHKGGDIDISVVPRGDLIAALRKCHDTLWAGGQMSPPAAFSELCKVIFVKLADEAKARKPGEPYDFQVKTGESAEALAARLGAIFDEQRRRSPDVFTAQLLVTPQRLKTLVEHLQAIDLSSTDVDVKGVAFELFMGSYFKGDSGQYFTPRELIRFCVQLADIKPDDLVVDPACGSSGFLLYALEAIRDMAETYYPDDATRQYAMWRAFATNNIFGIEINDEITRVAKMNMILHGDGQTNVICNDALVGMDQLAKLNSHFQIGGFDLVLTNPPFGASIKLDERPYLARYELGMTTPKTGRPKPRKSQASEIVFIERVWQLVKPGTGRVVIVLPDGILTNARTQYVRDFILDRFQVQAVVSLPISAFMHYGAGVKASIVMMRRLGQGEASDPNSAVFLAEASMVGYDATGRECPNQLPEIAHAYVDFVKDPSAYVVDIPEMTSAVEIDESEEDE